MQKRDLKPIHIWHSVRRRLFKMIPLHIWHSVRGRLFILLVLVLAIALICVSLFINNIFRSHLLHERRIENLVKADDVSNILESYIRSVITSIKIVSLNDSFLEGSITAKTHALERLLGKLEEAKLFLLLDINGNELIQVSSSDAFEKGSIDRIRNEGTTDAVLGGDIMVSHVFQGEDSIRLLGIFVPLQVNSKTQGVLITVISLNDGIFKRLQNIDISQGIDILIVDTNGWPIALMSRGISEDVKDNVRISPIWKDFGDILKVKQYMSGVNELKLETPLIYENINKDNVLGVLVTCPVLKWGIIIEEKLNIILEPIQKILKRYVVMAIGVFIILCILAAIILAYLTSPLLKLSKYTKGLVDSIGRLSIRKDDEIGRIAEGINQLIDRLSQKGRELLRGYKELEAVSIALEDSYSRLDLVTKDLGGSWQKLLHGKGFINRIINGISLLIIGLDLEGNVLIFNKWSQKRLQYDIDEVKGKCWFDIVYPIEKKDTSRIYFKNMLEKKDIEPFKDTILAKDGSAVTVQWHVSLINDLKGRVDGIVFIGLETEEKRGSDNTLLAENLQLKRSNEELENILSIVSHDLKNPLYIIQDFASIIDQEYKDALSEDILYYLERIKVNAKHMEKLIKDLLELSRTTRVKGTWQECSVSEIVRRVVDELKESINSKGILIRMAENFPIIRCDSESILRVFMNLISNSIKFIGDTANPFIEIGWTEREDEYEFFVRDNGIGIEYEYHEKIFVIFQRLQEVKGVEGTGVGLTIVKKVIENHGGRVWVESKKGEGATFYFTIPRKLPEVRKG